MTKIAQSRYSGGAIVLHWLIALGIVANWLVAQYADWLDEHKLEAQHQAIMGKHFAIGLTVLILSVLRVIWRLMHKPPDVSPAHKPWERMLAHIIHKLFYVLILALPLSGYLMIEAHSGGMSVNMFGLFDFPALAMAKSRQTSEAFGQMHGLLADGMVVLFVLHVAGALKHQLLDRDRTINRMLPFGGKAD